MIDTTPYSVPHILRIMIGSFAFILLIYCYKYFIWPMGQQML